MILAWSPSEWGRVDSDHASVLSNSSFRSLGSQHHWTLCLSLEVRGPSHGTIKITLCSYLLNNVCVIFCPQNLPVLERIFRLLESAFPPSLAFESFALSLNNHYSPPCFQYAANPAQRCILFHVLTKHISSLPPLLHLWLRSARSCLSPPLTVRASNSNILTEFP